MGGEGSASAVPWRQVRSAAADLTPAMQEELRDQAAQIEKACEQRVRDARAAGLREGEAAGRGKASAQVEPVIAQLSRTIADLSQLRPQLRRQAEGDMIKLAIEIARRVLRRELSIDPDALHGLVLGALERLEAQEVSRVKVHPSHAESIRACLAQSPAGRSIEVVADTLRDPGVVIFETSRGNLDASIESQLNEIERGLADRLRKHHSS
jgi:flagellar assembly protein FliH